MNVIDAIKKRRSIRIFTDKEIDREILIELIDIARGAPSAANKQPLEYVIINEKTLAKKVFEQLAWAAYVQPKRNPPDGHRPTAYIIVLINQDHLLKHFGPVDAAAAITTILLAAIEKGLGTCWLASVKRENLREILSIPDNLEIDSVVALGYPDEEPIMEDSNDDSIKYYLDDENRLHVPKRPLSKILHLNSFGG